MKLIKQFFCIGLWIVVLLLFSGCSASFSSIDSLLKPPKLTEQQNLIYEALKQSSKQNISLLYPLRGDYTSAFIIEDMTGDDHQEALIFSKENSLSQSIRIHLLQQTNETWQTAWENTIAHQVTHIEKVNFIRMDQSSYVVIGFHTIASDEIMLAVYEYDHDRLVLSFEMSVLNYEIGDLSNHKQSQIVTLTSSDPDGAMNNMAPLPQATRTIYASLYGLQEKNWKMLSQTLLREGITSYPNLFFGKLDQDISALYLDGLMPDDRATTQILIAPNNQIQNITNDIAWEESQRPGSFSVRDFQGNGVYYIPHIVYFPDYSPHENALYMLTWYSFSLNTHQLSQEIVTFPNYPAGYELHLPTEWIGKVGAKRDFSKNEVLFFIDDPQQQHLQKKLLLQLQLISSATAPTEEIIPMGYKLLERRGNFYYVYKLYITNTPLDISEEQLRELFGLI